MDALFNGIDPALLFSPSFSLPVLAVASQSGFCNDV